MASYRGTPWRHVASSWRCWSPVAPWDSGSRAIARPRPRTGPLAPISSPPPLPLRDAGPNEGGVALGMNESPASVEQVVARAIGEPLSGRVVSVKAWPRRANSSLALVSPALDEFKVREELGAH